MKLPLCVHHRPASLRWDRARPCGRIQIPSVEVSWVPGTESKKGARGKKSWGPCGMGDEDPGGSVLWKMFVG